MCFFFCSYKLKKFSAKATNNNGNICRENVFLRLMTVLRQFLPSLSLCPCTWLSSTYFCPKLINVAIEMCCFSFRRRALDWIWYGIFLKCSMYGAHDSAWDNLIFIAATNVKMHVAILIFPRIVTLKRSWCTSNFEVFEVYSKSYGAFEHSIEICIAFWKKTSNNHSHISHAIIALQEIAIQTISTLTKIVASFPRIFIH